MGTAFTNVPGLFSDVALIIQEFGPWLTLTIALILILGVLENATGGGGVSDSAARGPASAGTGGGGSSAVAGLLGVLQRSGKGVMSRMPKKQELTEAQRLSAVGISALKDWRDSGGKPYGAWGHPAAFDDAAFHDPMHGDWWMSEGRKSGHSSTWKKEGGDS